jgi:hypothetical protein
MKKEIALAKDILPPDHMELGTWLGRRQAFGLMSGKSAAADIQCLRHIRDRKLYRSEVATWKEFCTRYVGASKPQVDRQIQYLEEFGTQFFELTALTRISAETYRAIAAEVRPEGLHLDGDVIPLSPENSQRISSAVAELRRRRVPPQAGERESGFALLERRLEEAIGALAEFPPLDSAEKVSLASLLMRLRACAAAAGVQVIGR